MVKKLLSLLALSVSVSCALSAQTKLIKSEKYYDGNLENTVRYGYNGPIKSISPIKGTELANGDAIDFSHLADSILMKDSNGEYKLYDLITYNNQQVPIKKNRYNTFTGALLSTTDYTYHSNGVLSKNIIYSTDLSFVEEKNYDDSGRLLIHKRTEVINRNTITSQYIVEYDHNKLKREYNQVYNPAVHIVPSTEDSIEYFYRGSNFIADYVYTYGREFMNNSQNPITLKEKRYLTFNSANDTLSDSTYSVFSNTSKMVKYRYAGDSVISEHFSFDNNNNPIVIPTYRIKSVDVNNGDIIESYINYIFHPSYNKIMIGYASGNIFDANGYLIQSFGYSEDSLGNLSRRPSHTVYRNSDHNIDSIVYSNMKYINYYESALSVDQISKSDINIYPNPSTGIFNLEIKDIAQYNVIVYDAMGRVVGSFDQAKQIDITHQPVGNYIFRVIDHKTQTSYIHQVIKQ